MRFSTARTGENISIPALHNIVILSVPLNSDIPVLCTKLNRMKGIEFAEPNYLSRVASTTPNDPFYSSQQNLEQPSDHDIDVTRAWAKNTGSSNVRVAVVDTGIDYHNPYLGAGFGSTAIKVKGGYDYANSDNDPMDDDINTSHGTVSAGIIGALSNNGFGVAGIAGGDVAAGNNGVQLIGLKVGSDLSQAINAIYDASVSQNSGGYGCNIINYSAGFYPTAPDPLGQVNSLRKVVSFAAQNGVVVVAAKGNDNSSNTFLPADFADNLIMSIGGSDNLDFKEQASNYGGSLDVIAPFEYIESTAIGPSATWMRSNSGTSVSAPQVSGIAALLRSANPNLHRDDVENIIEFSAERVHPETYTYTNGYNNLVGNGRVNAGNALELISPPFVLQQFTITGGVSQQITSGNGEGLIINNDVGGLASDWYYGQMFQVTTTVNLPVFQCGNNYVWTRTSNANQGWSAANPNNQMGYSFVVSRTNTTVTLRTFVYYIKYNSIAQTFNAWYPCAPQNVVFAYTTVGILGAPLVINGPSSVCTIGTYTLQTLAPGFTLSWSSNNSGILSINPNSGMATRQNNGNGQVTLTATVTDGTCSATSSVIVTVGLPVFNSTTIDGNTQVYPLCSSGTNITYTANQDHIIQIGTMGGSDPTFTLNDPSHLVSGSLLSSGRYHFISSSTSPNFTISYSSTNTCGTTTQCLYFSNSGSCIYPAFNSFSVSPGPTLDCSAATTAFVNQPYTVTATTVGGIPFAFNLVDNLHTVTGTLLSPTQYKVVNHNLNYDFLVFATASTICGTTSKCVYFSSTGGGGLSPVKKANTVGTATVNFYPNPVSTTLTVQVTDSVSTNTQGTTLDQPYSLFLMDRFSQKVFSAQSSDKTLQIPTDGLPADIYYLIMMYKDAVLQKQILIKK